jgi:PIN domain nuclease of toxin-antitoxin system
MKNQRYYLDTNMLLFILSNADEIDKNVSALLKDIANILYTSSIAVQELLFLLRIEKIRSKIYKTEEDLLNGLAENSIEIIFFNSAHFLTYTKIHIIENHKDMNDHAIIAQAISDKITLISSDNAFKNYTSQGLKFLFNKR